jgi:hypothetical protein
MSRGDILVGPRVDGARLVCISVCIWLCPLQLYTGGKAWRMSGSIAGKKKKKHLKGSFCVERKLDAERCHIRQDLLPWYEIWCFFDRSDLITDGRSSFSPWHLSSRPNIFSSTIIILRSALSSLFTQSLYPHYPKHWLAQREASSREGASQPPASLIVRVRRLLCAA